MTRTGALNRPRVSDWLRWSIGVLILAGLAWQAVHLAQTMPSAPWPRNPLPVALSVVPAVLAFLAFAWSWIELAARDDWRSAGRLWFASLLARYVPGAVWQGAVRVAGARAAGTRVGRAVAQFASEQSLACASAALLALLLIGAGASLPDGLVPALAATAILAIAAPLLLSRRMPSVRWPSRAILAMATGHGLLAAGFALFVLGWHEGPLADALAFAQALLVAGLAGVLAVFVPAGLGVREGVLAWLLAPLLGPAEALAVALASRAWTTGCELLAWASWQWIAARR